ncbi:MAG: AAA family ATPase [Candidatus Micrarchaeota archaeon]|nr:AAA family ATPase [Candidatus Micrarchaeota archaeon]
MLNTGMSSGSVKIEPKKISGVRIFLPPRLQEKADFLKSAITHYGNYGKLGTFGTLCKGLPRTGKTEFVRYIAQETGSLLWEMPVLESPEAIVQVMTDARKYVKEHGGTTAMPFFDDIEYLGKRSEGSVNQSNRAILASLLGQTQSKENLGLFPCFTTNEEGMLDEALNSPPRITINIEFIPPTKAERYEMINAIVEGAEIKKFEWNENTRKYAAEITYGYVPGDLFGIIQTATFMADMRKSSKVEKVDVDRAKSWLRASAIRDMPFIEPRTELESLVGEYIQPAKELLCGRAARIDAGSLLVLYGPSSYGKSKLLEAVAHEFGFNLINVNTSHLISMWQGESGKAVRNVIQSARNAAKCILSLDEADGVLNPDSPYSSEWLSVLKAETSERIPGVMFVLCANDPSRWDPAILNRFKKAFIGKAGPEDMKLIIASKLPKGHEVDLSELMKYVNEKSVNPRMIEDAIRDIVDEGMPVTTELLKDTLMKKKPPADTYAWDDIRNRVGDDLESYKVIREYKKKG